MANLVSLRRVTSGSFYLPAIDGLRFLAIVPVVLWHLNSRTWNAFSVQAEFAAGRDTFDFFNRWLGAKTGVELFFVISGFILAMPFLKAALQGKPWPSLKLFYRRRLTRLEPPYLVATLAAFAFLALSSSRTSEMGFVESNGFSLIESLIASIFYLHGPVFQALPQIIPVAWSLEIEFQFYIIAPLFFYAFTRFPKGNIRIGLGALILIGLAFSINFVQAEIGALIRFLLFRYLHFFLLGVILCQLFLARNYLTEHVKKNYFLDIAFIFSLFFLFYSETLMPDYRKPTLVGLEILRLFCFSIIFLSAFLGRLASRFLSSTAITIIGGMCYSIYLVHLPLQQLLIPQLVSAFSPADFSTALAAAFAFSIPLTLLASVIFFRTIERPCMSADWPERLLALLSVVFSRKNGLSTK